MTEPKPTQTQYLDLVNTPTEVLDAMGPRYPAWDLDQVTPTLTLVDARQFHITVVQQAPTTPAPAQPAPAPPQLEPPAPDPEPVPLVPQRTWMDWGDFTAMVMAVCVITLLIGMVVFVEFLVALFSAVLTALALVAVVGFLLSLGGGKCPGIHCGGCK